VLPDRVAVARQGIGYGRNSRAGILELEFFAEMRNRPLRDVFVTTDPAVKVLGFDDEDRNQTWTLALDI
jgi:hypothetical protein